MKHAENSATTFIFPLNLHFLQKKQVVQPSIGKNRVQKWPDQISEVAYF